MPELHPIPPIRIVGLGLAALDILVRTSDLPTWECGVRLRALGIDGGGPVATALVAAQRLGVQTGYVGTCGSDRLGRIKLETLSEHGVDVSHIVQRPGAEESAILVCVQEATGERIFSGASHPDFQALQVEELNPAYITSADYLHLDGCHVQAALAAARWMRQAGKRVMLDGATTRGPVSPQMRLLVAEANVLICGSGFGPALTGQADLRDAGAAILQMGPEVVVQTEGSAGSYTSTQNESFHTPAFQVDVVDTTGAGDVFHGAYLVGLLHGWDLRSIALFSSAVAGMKCSRLGGRQGIPTFEQTMDFLSRHGIHIT